LERTTLALSLYVLAITPGLNIETTNRFNRKALAVTAIGASPFVFEGLGMALVRSKKALDVEDYSLFNPSTRLSVRRDADVRSINRDISMGFLVSTVQEPKSKAKSYFGFGHVLGFGRPVFFPHYWILKLSLSSFSML
jgi:hypothetical protein